MILRTSSNKTQTETVAKMIVDRHKTTKVIPQIRRRKIAKRVRKTPINSLIFSTQKNSSTILIRM